MQGVVEFLTKTSLQIYQGIFQLKNICKSAKIWLS